MSLVCLVMANSGGGFLTAVGTVGYYTAYAFIAWKTLRGDFSIGDLTFLSGSFRRLRTLYEEAGSAAEAARRFASEPDVAEGVY